MDNPPEGDKTWRGMTTKPARSKAPFKIYNIRKIISIFKFNSKVIKIKHFYNIIWYLKF